MIAAAFAACGDCSSEQRPDASEGEAVQASGARRGGNPAQAEPSVEALARLVAGSGLTALGPPDGGAVSFERVLVVVDPPGWKGDGVDWSGFALPRYPVLGSWRVLKDGTLERLENGCPPSAGQPGCLWVGLAESRPEGLSYYANVLAGGLSSGARLTIARADGGWAVKSTEVTWVE